MSDGFSHTFLCPSVVEKKWKSLIGTFRKQGDINKNNKSGSGATKSHNQLGKTCPINVIFKDGS